MTSRIKRYIHISPRLGFFLAGMGVSLVLFTSIVSGAIPCVTPTGGGVAATVHTGPTNSQGNGNGNGQGNNNGNGNGQAAGQGNGNGLGVGVTVSGNGNGGNGGGLNGGIGVGVGTGDNGSGNGAGNGSGNGSGSGSGAGASTGCTSPLLTLTTSGLLNSCTTASTASDGSLNINHTNNSALASSLLNGLGTNLIGSNGSGSSSQRLLNVTAPVAVASVNNGSSTSSSNGAAQNSALSVSVRPQVQSNTQSSASASSSTSGNSSTNQPARHSIIRVNAPAVSSAGNVLSVGSASSPASAASSLVTVNTSQPSSQSQSGNGTLANLGL